jgi:Trypsin-co-occurring domain 2
MDLPLGNNGRKKEVLVAEDRTTGVDEYETTLADALESLRHGLEQAWDRGQNQKVRFAVSNVTLTVETEVRKATQGGVGVRWYVLSAGGSKKTDTGSTQTLVLTLTPGFYDKAGNRVSSLAVAAEQPTPGR